MTDDEEKTARRYGVYTETSQSTFQWASYKMYYTQWVLAKQSHL